MKELEKFSLLELKGMVYDFSQQASTLRQQLEILNQEIARRQQLQSTQVGEIKEGE